MRWSWISRIWIKWFTRSCACTQPFQGKHIYSSFISVYLYSYFTSRIERECNKDITINNIRFKKGMLVTVPTYALHYDPEYYPDPYTFDPDRCDTKSYFTWKIINIKITNADGVPKIKANWTLTLICRLEWVQGTVSEWDSQWRKSNSRCAPFWINTVSSRLPKLP